MIDKIYILNVKSQKHRLTTCYNKLKEIIPEENIGVFEASAAEDFSKTRELCVAAADDGFPFFQTILDNRIHNKALIGYLAQGWSYLRFLRHIQETKENAVLLHDDHYLTCSFNELLDLFQLLPKPPALVVFTTRPITDKSMQALPNSTWLKGLNEHSCDYGIYYTPEIARSLLEELNNHTSNALGWMACDMWHILQTKNYPDMWTLNKPNLSVDYGMLHASMELPSTLHHHDGTIIRPPEETKD